MAFSLLGRWGGFLLLSFCFLGRVIQFGCCALQSELSADSNLSVLTPAGQQQPLSLCKKSRTLAQKKKKCGILLAVLWPFFNYGNFIMIF